MANSGSTGPPPRIKSSEMSSSRELWWSTQIGSKTESTEDDDGPPTRRQGAGRGRKTEASLVSYPAQLDHSVKRFPRVTGSRVAWPDSVGEDFELEDARAGVCELTYPVLSKGGGRGVGDGNLNSGDNSAIVKREARSNIKGHGSCNTVCFEVAMVDAATATMKKQEQE
ncbi:hypothetical protein EDD18DRAFT_1101026 [Armillaria luteobubalina]|uniref:Uncharacterized protein n=1 Tax=Armillaria luteobubalina TaxID=153913 RepID=A0AA39QG10_9AGAR|nr:hypothetical protein EDD18DRAFT_1101026 [Armillaria luteobubalina]